MLANCLDIHTHELTVDRWRSTCPEHSEKLVSAILSREQRLQPHHLSHDAPARVHGHVYGQVCRHSTLEEPVHMFLTSRGARDLSCTSLTHSYRRTCACKCVPASAFGAQICTPESPNFDGRRVLLVLKNTLRRSVKSRRDVRAALPPAEDFCASEIAQDQLIRGRPDKNLFGERCRVTLLGLVRTDEAEVLCATAGPQKSGLKKAGSDMVPCIIEPEEARFAVSHEAGHAGQLGASQY